MCRCAGVVNTVVLFPVFSKPQGVIVKPSLSEPMLFSYEVDGQKKNALVRVEDPGM